MNTKEISKEMKNIACFKGVFPLDKISKFKIVEKPFGMIMNLDYSNERGSHWVALYVDEENKATYFDSFGFPNFNIHLLKFLELNEVFSIIFNKFQLQSVNSKTCGAYCILFIKMCCHGYSFRDFLKIFSNNKDRNDLISIKIIGNIK